jgi:hypothetical protein
LVQRNFDSSLPGTCSQTYHAESFPCEEIQDIEMVNTRSKDRQKTFARNSTRQRSRISRKDYQNEKEIRNSRNEIRYEGVILRDRQTNIAAVGD